MNKKDRKLIAKAYELSNSLWNYAVDNKLEGALNIAKHFHKVINRLEDELRVKPEELK